MNICIVNCFDTWEHRVDMLVNCFEQSGHDTTVLMSDFQHMKKVFRKEDKDGYRFFRTDPYYRNISPRRLMSHTGLADHMFEWLEDNPGTADLLWVLAPPNSFISKAARWKDHHPGKKLVIDIIDLWPESFPIGRLASSRLLSPWRSLRTEHLRPADLVTTQCTLYRKILRRELQGIDSRTLYLAREDSGYVPNLHLPTNEVSLLYLGSINHIIDIERIVAVIDQIHRQSNVTLHIIGDGENRAELLQKADRAGAKVKWHGSIYDRTEKQKIIDGCHFGLNVFRTSVKVGMTMKSIDYFEFGLPLINSIPGDTWAAVRKFGCGVNLNGMYLPPLPPGPEARQAARTFFERYLTESVFRRHVEKILSQLA